MVHRRENVKKVTLNQYITPDVKLLAHPTNDKALSWVAFDAAEPDETGVHKFLMRFETGEITSEFWEAYLSAQKKQAESGTAKF